MTGPSGVSTRAVHQRAGPGYMRRAFDDAGRPARQPSREVSRVYIGIGTLIVLIILLIIIF